MLRCFVFFKQKTAYEMRISDWSSDVCSSDLELIAQYEGRLLSFVESRLRRRDASEDVVQETFIGFLTSLPNYDTRRSLESWLFTIAAHKLKIGRASCRERV